MKKLADSCYWLIGTGGGRMAGNPTQQGVPHVVEIPAITMLSLGGRTLYENATLQGNLPRLVTTTAGGVSGVRVVRPNWAGR
jgi:hypothetical protein